MPPRSRGSSVRQRGPPGSHNPKKDEERDLLNPSQLNDLLLSVIDYHSHAPIEIVEVASDMLLDRFVEFASQSVVVRAYEGAKEAGRVDESCRCVLLHV